MQLSFVDAPTATEWNARLAANPAGANIFQSHELGEIKQMARWRPRYAVVGDVAMTIHEKSAGPFGKVWYLPKGPCVATPAELAPVVAALREAARRDRVLFVRIEPEIVESPEHLAELEALGLVATDPVQPNTSTVLHALPESAEELMASYPSKTRNMVRRAQRDGVVVEQAPPTQKTFDTVWSLWQEVVQDHELGVRSKDYHVQSWRILVRDGLASIFIAHAGGEPVASAVVGVLGGRADYKEGASLRDRPVPGASQLVQYEAMSWAIGRGARVYDLVGAPHSSRIDDPTHPRHGIGKFKRGFTKEVVDWVGAFDLVLHCRRYALWQRLGERVVARAQRREPGDTFW